jgi:hypothetical protein
MGTLLRLTSQKWLEDFCWAAVQRFRWDLR